MSWTLSTRHTILLILAITLAVHGLGRLLGPHGAALAALVVMLIGIISIIVRGLNPSIDFKGGAEFQGPINGHSISDVTSAVSSAGVHPESSQTTGTGQFQVETATLTNPQTTAVALGGFRTYGNFAQTNNCPATLAPGGSCTVSVTVTRFCSVIAGVTTCTGSAFGPRGIGPKYFVSSAFSFTGSKSPAIASDALLGV